MMLNEMTEPMRPPMRVKLGGLWRNTTKTGKTFLSGKLGYDTSIEIWPNQKREGSDKDPDYQIFITQREKERKPDTTNGMGMSANPEDFTVPF